MKSIRFLLAAALTASPAILRADTLKLKNGKVYEGTVTEVGDSYEIAIPMGKIVDHQTVKKADVAEFIRTLPDEKESKDLAALVPTADAMPASAYEAVLKEKIEPFLKKYPVSKFRAAVDSAAKTYRDELARVKAGDAALIDARPAEFFKGDTRHVAASVPGTLQGAVNVEHDKWFAPGTATFVSAEQAQKVAASSAIDPAKETVSFCNTGHWAATNWFAMSEVLGQKNVKLYAGSMVEWSKDASGLPMANVPSRPKQLMIDAKFWAEKTFK